MRLSRVFRKFTGVGIVEYVDGLRNREACDRMLDPEPSWAEIRYDLGFADQSHFTRTFHA